MSSDTTPSNTATINAWASRIGPNAARCLARHRRNVRAGWWLITAGLFLLVIGVLVASSTGDSPAGMGTVVMVTVFEFLGVLSVIIGGTVVWSGRRQRFQAEGYVLRLLLPRNPSLTAVDIRAHLARTADFDTWQQQARLVLPTAVDDPLPAWTWSAGASRPLLPGRSAAARQQFVNMALLATLVCIIGIPISVMANHTVPYHPSTPSIMFLIFAAACAIAAAGLQAGTWARFRREYGAGYTTLVPRVIRRSTIDMYTGVDLIDVKTGHVIRAAGALPLTPKKLATRLAILRSATDTGS